MGFQSVGINQLGSSSANSSFTTSFGGAVGTSPALTPTALGAGATSLGPSTASSVAAATNIGFSTPSTVSLPSWLTTDPDSLQKELTDQYGSAGKAITDAANKAGNKASKAADINYGQEMREGQNATSQQTAVNRQQGGTAKTSSIVAGQMASQAGKDRVDARVQIAQMKLGATEQAANLSSQIAGQMASLRTSYLGMLAGTSTSMRGQDISESDFTQSQAQQASEFAGSLQGTKSSGSGTNGVPLVPMYTGPNGAGMGIHIGPGANSGTGTYQNIYSAFGG